jgi:hypothetical protein
MLLVTGQPPGFTSNAISQNGRTGSFRPAERWKKRLGSRFYQESARAKTKNGNSFLRPSSMERAKTGGQEIRGFLQGILPLGA